eukprot:10121591-Lingulodinium_polyedra.AAC.1
MAARPNNPRHIVETVLLVHIGRAAPRQHATAHAVWAKPLAETTMDLRGANLQLEYASHGDRF